MQDSEITAEQWEDLRDKARKASASAARSWGSAIEADDIQQEVMVKMVESPGFVRKSLANGDDSTWRLVRMMADQCASGLMNDYRRFSFQHSYSAWDVRQLLDRGVLDEPERASVFEAQADCLATGRKSKKDFAERITFDDKLDLEYGMGRLNDNYRNAILDRYVRGVEPSHRKVLSRAMESLTMHMNTSRAHSEIDYQGTGSRSATGNAAARKAAEISY
ncbi:hypothetical protein ACFZCK_14040 [Kitasatospora purpeofusca]|uniref:hypothetical protein n=1 Tax=Kitasatospora purpeofusca TaxID=67352 RepID=UPI0036E819B8